MIESIQFANFKALRKTTLPLAPFTLLLGPNGSGKTSVLQALKGISVFAAAHINIQHQDIEQDKITWSSLLSVNAQDANGPVEVKTNFRFDGRRTTGCFRWHPNGE